MKEFTPSRYVAICLIFLASLCFNQKSVYGIALTDIRTGFHKTYSRLVLQFDTDVKFQVIKDLENGTVIIDVLGVGPGQGTKPVRVHPEDTFLKRVNIRQSQQLLSVTAILKIPNLRVDHYYMRWPSRIVVDIYRSSLPGQGTASVAAGRQQEKKPLQPPATNSVAGDSSQVAGTDSSALVEISADSLAPLTTPEYDSTGILLAQSIRPLEKSLNSVKSELQKIVRKPRKNDTNSTGKRDLVIAILAGFLLLDGIVLGVYFLRRVSRTRPQQPDKIEKAPATRRPNQPFVEVLKATLNEGEIEEVRKQPEIVTKKEVVEVGGPQTFAAWKAGMTTPRRGAPVAPDLNDVAKDLGTILDATTTTPQLSKEELIGKDGAEFLENLRRHSFS
ncbi:MAG: hypothetical protein ACE5G1_04470 [bacterium]